MTDPERCPICDGPLRPTRIESPDRLVRAPGTFTVRECTACEYGVTVPQPAGAALAAHYAESYYESYYEHSGAGQGLLSRARSFLRERGAERRQSRPPFQLDGIAPGKVLEVGCGNGELLAHFAGQGWRTYGIDPSSVAVAAAARRGATVHEGVLADRPWPEERFDLIVFQHSLEHIPGPVDEVRRATALLAPGGRLIIDVPNWASWQRRLFGNCWVMLDLPRHLQHFSPLALERLAATLGLRTAAVGTNSNAIATAYSVHYILAGRWTPGWKLWLSYAVSVPLLPLIWAGDRRGGGDACYAVLTPPARRS